MNDKRAVITGIGVVAPNGIGKDAYWKALAAGISGIKAVSLFDTAIFPSHVAGEINKFEAQQYMPVKVIKRTDRSTHFAIAATSMAFEDSKLELNEDIKDNINIIIGTAMSGHVSYIEQLRIYFTKGYKNVSPFAAVSCFPDACSGQLAIFFGIKGPSETICAGCAASTNAIIEAYKRIKLGEAEVCVAGGTDAPLREEIFCAFCQSKILTQKSFETPSPFDRDRDGTVLSEGAGIVIVEDLGHAMKRNAKIYAEIIGSGTTTDAYHMAGSDPTGKERSRAITTAIKTAAISLDEVEYINAHGTGTVMNDTHETAVIKNVFGDYAYKIPINSTKSMIGHTQGAAGALEIIATVQVLNEGIIHPTINYKNQDPECDLNYVPNTFISKNVNIALSNSFAFGGKNSVIALKKYKQ